ncbi:MAG: non-canonical purine NTP pyrophosphatase [Planctomycetota bacterium]
MHKLVLATNNEGKAGELRRLFGDAGLELKVVTIGEIAPGLDEPKESHEPGTTFEHNAALKARYYARATGLPCLGDDSGLEVDALGGAPGVISSHFAWDGATTGEPATLTRPQRDEHNNRRLLREMRGVEGEARSARFVCTMVLARPDGEIACVTRGTLEARIGTPPDVPRGEMGFGYDPLMLVAPDFTRTGAELEPLEKNSVSHRGQAARALIERLHAGVLGGGSPGNA